ncbi:hypothetical protein [Clostridium carboxidivorans]|uniref:hypothetical protein n=1 Tax=Clostridium carboxidivorans TaxID=217159 RepID=UPI00031A652A|nr:hypothetical protein [Clostridium carboxidivorans]
MSGNYEITNNVQENNKIENRVLDKSLYNNISLFKNIFKNDEMLIVREFQNKTIKSGRVLHYLY